MDKEKLQKEIVDAIAQIAKNEARKNSKITIVKGEITGVDPLNCYYNFSYNNHLYSARSVLGGYSVGQKVFIAFSGEQENNIILCGEIIGGGTVAGSDERVLSSIIQQYYISNSSEIEPPQNPGEGAQYQWSDTKLTPTEEAPYLWTRYKYIYTDASITYSTPYVLNLTEAINESDEIITDYIDSSISNIQSQIDKKADIWFYNGIPSLNTYPANEWTTNEIKDIHIGDLYFDTSETSGKAYEFKKDQSTYLWQLVQDQDVIKALNDAAKAQDTADNKRRVFYSTPIPPYDKGDLWVQGSNGDILYCNTPKGSGATYSRSDWVIASKYTDDSNLNIFKEEYTHYKEDNDRKWENTLGKITTIEGQVEENTSSIQQTAEELSSSVSSITTTIGSLQDQIDGAIETYYLNGTPTLSNEPAVSWKDNETKDTHIGDLYYDKDTGYAYRFMKDESTYTWVKISDEDISKAFAEAEKANKAAEKAQGDVNNLTEVVNENTTNIQQNSEQITINAQETTRIKNNLSNNYYTKEEANAAIKTSADNISLSVEKTYTKKEDVEKNVISMVEQFYLSDSPTNLSGGSWSTSSPQWQNGKYIWRRTYVTYFDQTSEYTPSEKGVCITGNDGKNGTSGEAGVGIETITNYYLATSSNSGITVDSPGWTEEVQTITVTKRYLWNYEKTLYTDQSMVLTEPCVIGVYGETGQPGKDGTNGADGADGTSVTITSTVTDYQKSTSGTTPPTGTWSTSIPTVPAGQYLWTRVQVVYSNGTSTTSYSVARQGQNGTNGRDGADGTSVTITSKSITYNVHTSGTSAPTDTWTSTIPTVPAGQYLWTRTIVNYSNGSNTTAYSVARQGEDGEQGIQGPPGENGKTLYTWLKYADSPTSGMSDSPTGKKYIGLAYNKTTSSESTNYSDYTWSLIKGADGADGAPGPAGENGQSLYTWIKYADSATGSGMSNTPDGKKYIGLAYNKTTATESNIPGDYTWSLIKGADGQDGKDGADGKDGTSVTVTSTVVDYQKSTNGTTPPTGTWSTSIPTVSAGSYLWTRTRVTYSDGKNTTSYSVARQGANGANGSSVTVTDTEVTYASSTSGTATPSTGWQTTIPSVAAGSYLWTKTVVTYSDGKSTTAYSVARQGQNGAKGDQGIQGPPGEDGQTLYTWIKYADTPTSGMSDSPTGKEYIGIAYNKTSKTESSTYSDYAWSKILGNQGPQGPSGEDGQTLYTWIKYADSATGSGMSDSPSGKEYIGIAYNKTTATESNTPGDYTWSLIKGADGQDGKDGTSVTITKTEITYKGSTSGTTPPSGTWSTAIPTVPAGQYLWTKTVVTYSDGKSTTAYSVSRIGANGSNGSDGKNGTSVTITDTSVTYQKSTSGTTPPTGSWTTTIPATSAGEYLWTKTVVTYSDGTSTTSHSVSRNGSNGATGKGIKSVTNYYLASASGSGVTTGTSGWTTTVQNISSSKKYLWNYEKITYTDNSTTSTSPCIIGTYGRDGTDGAAGEDGVGISSIQEYYQISSSGTTAPSSWVTTPPTMTASKKYLWNYEKITYTNSTTKETAKRVIGVYGDKGQTGATGATGNGIKTIENYYLASTASSGVTVSTSGWTTTVQSVSASKKYLWNYEKVTYTNGNSISTDPCIIGAYGDKGATGATGPQGPQGDKGATGNGISSITEYYQVSTSSSTAPTSWSTTVPTLTSTNKYLWNYEKITYTNGSSVETKKRVIGVYGDKGSTGSTGATGTGISSITVEFYLSTSKTTQTGGSWTTTQPTWTTGKYLWTRQKIVYKNPASTVYTTPQCDSSWEAVNEVEVGGRNYVIATSDEWSNWITPGTGTNKCFLAYTVDLKKLNLSYGDTISLQIEWEGQNFVSSSEGTVRVYSQGAVNGVWNGDNYFTNPWTNLINGNRPVDELNSIRKYTKIYTFPNSSIDKINSVGGVIQLQFRADYCTADARYRYKRVKIEKGNKPTEWTPAPEDVQQGIDNAQDAANNAQNTANDNKVNIEVNSSKIDILDKSIQSLVVHKDVNGEYQSSMIQDETGWHFDITSITNDISKSLTGLNSAAQAIESNSNAIEGVQSDIDDIAAKTAYITITQKDGNPYMELGSTTSNFKLGISNTSIDFMDGTNRVAYISNQNLYIERSIIKNELQIGEGTKFIWKKRENGNLGLRWESE